MELFFVLKSESAHTAHFFCSLHQRGAATDWSPAHYRVFQSHTIVHSIVWKHSIRVCSVNFHSLEHGIWLAALTNLQNRVQHLTRVCCRFCLMVWNRESQTLGPRQPGQSCQWQQGSLLHSGVFPSVFIYLLTLQGLSVAVLEGPCRRCSTAPSQHRVRWLMGWAQGTHWSWDVPYPKFLSPKYKLIALVLQGVVRGKCGSGCSLPLPQCSMSITENDENELFSRKNLFNFSW